jgi:lysozyme
MPATKYSQNAVDLIKRYESLRLKAYKPTADDVWTIGWGHTRGVKRGQLCTPAEAEKWLHEDIKEAERHVRRVSVPLTQNQWDALTSLCFNVGYPPTLMKLLNLGEYAKAAEEFDKWIYQAGRVLNGLVRRRAEEKALFLLPDCPPPDAAVES